MADPKAIAAEFALRETVANKAPRGADHQLLLVDVAEWARVSVSEVKQAVLDHLFTR